MPIPLRADFDAQMVRSSARRSKDGPQARRLLALAAVYEGATRTEAAKIGGVTLQIVRDWVMKFNAYGPEGLIDRKPPGQPSRLTGAHRAALAAILASGPIPAVHGVVRWRIVDLCQWMFEEFRVVVARQTLSRELRAMGYRKLSARPRHHEQAEGAIEAFKKAFPRAWRRSGARRASSPPPSKMGAVVQNRSELRVKRSGSPTRPASAKRTRSPAVGPSAARVRARRRTNEPPRLISSARSAPSAERVQPSSCPDATPRP
jgi:transposase